MGQLCSPTHSCARSYPLFEVCLSGVWTLLWWWYLQQAQNAALRAWCTSALRREWGAKGSWGGHSFAVLPTLSRLLPTHLRQVTKSVQRASAEGSPSGRSSPFVCLSWQDVETEGSVNIKGSFRRIQTLISSYQLVKPGDKPNSLVLTAIIIRHLLCSLCSL